ncbi:YfcL family protein [Enterovibrio nigricans]|uniref:YfcL protein n=1 Tax=Enterovibrio nigricans DSM 22720 TaxID=1121868 RepID=A0A1T4U7J6_9GAMM|nr:YfcL family protein [Enterovibrio nigricans]PKF51765.1 YfcL family protein [Enterovibrio nigricans]SKA48715.1 YfcL protein [Enterovibrio nigricans DSM 22720]
MIQDYEEKILDFIDAMVETASDDELFASGYLRGHISLAAADCEQDGVDDVGLLRARVDSSLKENANELNPADQVLVANFWSSLQDKAN